MATNNALNLKSPGIVVYDGAGTFSSLATPLSVPNGGSGKIATLPYTVQCAGTTSTGNQQNIASVGTANQILTSNGSALPTFQAAPAGDSNLIFFLRTLIGSPADATTYFLVNGLTLTNSTASGVAITRFYVARAVTLTTVYGVATVAGTLGSSGNSTLAIRRNNTTDTTVTSTLAMTSAANTFSNTGLSISLSAGDYIEFKLTTPTWTTNPTNVSISITALMV